MMHYRNSILTFGVAIPAAIFVVLAGGGFIIRGQMRDSLAQKKAGFDAYEMNRRGLLQIEAQVGKKVADLDNWNKLLAEETSASFNSNFRKVADALPSEEFQQTNFAQGDVAAGLGTLSAQPSTQIKFSTRGTFKATQNALLELETRMPQLQLQELKIDPSSSSNSALNFQFSYTAWKK